ncbi:MAG TPA: hypothetical protein PLT32_03475, partial [bacterium]|nr:hypothetical protein [bacterium]
ESCCIVHDDNIFSGDKEHFASILGSDDNRSDASKKCREFAKEFSNLDSIDDVKDLEVGGWSPGWGVTNYENACPGAKNTCIGVLKYPCWDTRAGAYINRIAKGKDSASFCQTRNDGTSCILTSADNKRKWGYCQNGTCQTCLDYGADCSKDYQCPDEKKAIGQSTWVINWKCGDREGGVDGDCDGGKCAGKPKN